MSTLLLVPLDDTVVFPNMSVTLAVDVGDAERVLLVPRHEGEFAEVGTVAEVDRSRPPARRRARRRAEGLHRGVAGAAHTDTQGRLMVEVEERPDDEPVDGRTRNLEREYRAVVEEMLELRGDDGRDRGRSCAPSSSRARWPTRRATRPTSTSSRRSTCWPRST